MLTRLVRQAPLNLLVALALVSALAVGLFALFAAPAYAQSGMPSVSVTTLQTRMQEGDQALFTITRSGGDISDPLTVRIYSWEPQHPRNTFSSYYGTERHFVTFEAGSDTSQLIVSATDDGKGVAPAWLQVEVEPESDAPYRRGNPHSATVTITDPNDDVYITIAREQPEVEEGEDASFTLTRTGDTSEALTVHVQVDDPYEVMRGNHWDPAPTRPTSVDFDAGSDSVTLSLNTKDDGRDIPDPTLSVTLDGGNEGQGDGDYGYWIGYPHYAGVTVTDDDTAPEITFSLSPDPVYESETLTVTVSHPGGDVEQALMGRVRIEHDRVWNDTNASANQTNPFEESFAVSPGGTGWEREIQITDNNQREYDWQYTVTLLHREEVPEEEASQYWTVAGPATATVRDVWLPRVSIASNQDYVYEGRQGTFTLTRVGNTSEALTVTIYSRELADGIAPDNTAADSFTVTFAAGSATSTFSVAVIDDEVLEAYEDELEVAVGFPNSATYILGDVSVVRVPITEVETIAISTSQERVREGSQARFTLTRYSTDYSIPLTVRVYTWEPDHPRNDADNDYYHGAAHHDVAFELGARQAEFVVSATVDGKVADSDAELRADVDPSGTSYRGLGDNSTETIEIVDVDSPLNFVSITTGVSEINEGDSVDFLFTRDGDISESLTVQVQVDDPGEVMRGNHWLPTPTLPTSVEFEADQDTVTLSLDTWDDRRDIPDPTLSVILGGDDGYWIGHSHIARVTVNDDDTAPELTLSISPSEVDEGGELIVSIDRPADNTANFVVGRIRIEQTRPSTDSGAPVHVADPYEESFVLWQDRAGILQTIEVPINNLEEDDWQLTVTLLPSTSAPEDVAWQYWTAANDTVTATVRDAGLPWVTLAATQDSVYEGDDATFIITRTGDLSVPLTVMVGSAEQRGRGSSEEAEHDVVFEPGSATVILTLTAVEEDFWNRERGLVVFIDPDIPGDVRYKPSESNFVYIPILEKEASVSFQGDDLDPVAPGVQSTITEGETATLTLTREGYTGSALAVRVYVADPGDFMRGNHWQPVPAIPPVVFEAGEATTTLELPTRDDLRDIPNNFLTVIVLPDPDSYYTVSDPSAAEVMVEDNDVAPVVTMSVDKTEITEGESFRLTLTLTLTGDTSNPIEFPLLFGPEGDQTAQIYGLSAGESALTANVYTVDDDLDEADEQYLVELGTLAGVPADEMDQYWTVAGPRALTVTVLDNDLPMVGVRAGRESYTESQEGTFHLFRVGQTDEPMTINLRLSEVGDTVHEIGKEFLGDHVGAQGLTLPTGQSYGQYLVAIASNDGDEPDGQVTMQLLESDEYRIHPEHSAATFIVIDSDPTPVLTVTGATVAEGGGSIDFQVALSSTVSPPSLQTVTVEYETRDGAAVAGEDYTAVRGALTLAPEATGGVISVPLLDDGWAEYREAFSLVISNPSNAMLPDGQTSITVTGTIEDDEASVSVSSPAEVTEGEPVTLTFTRTGDTGEAMTFQIGVYEDHPSALNDFISPYVTIPAGQSSIQWDHETEDDDVDESDYTVSVSVVDFTQTTGRSRFTWDRITAATTVADNDLPTVQIQAVHTNVRHGDEATFILGREGDLVVPLTVNLSIIATNGFAHQDQAVSGFLTSEPPSTVTFPVGSETFTLRLNTNAGLLTPSVLVTATLVDGDDYNLGQLTTDAILSAWGDLPVVSIVADQAEVEEGQSVVFTLSRIGSVHSSLEANVELTKWNWNRRADENVTVTFQAGSLTAQFSRETEDEDLNDGDTVYEALLSWSSTHHVGVDNYPRQARTRVRDNDLPLVWLEPEMGEHIEDPDTLPTFTLHRDGDTSSVLEIIYHPTWVRFFSYKPDLVQAGYPLPHYIEAGNSSRTFGYDPKFVSPLGGHSTIRILPPDTPIRGFLSGYAPDVLIRDLRPRYRVGTPALGRIEVINREIGVSIEADQAEVEEGEDVTFTLRRFGGTPQSSSRRGDISVVATEEGTVISGDTPEAVSFPGNTLYEDIPAVHTITVTIPTTDDDVYEADGAVTLTLLPSPDQGALHTQYVIGGSEFFDIPASATVRVRDNDRPDMSIADASAFESDGVIKFTVTVAPGPRDVSVDWTTADSTGDAAAVAGEDYTAASGALTIPAGDATGTISVPVMDDDLHEGDETFTVRLSDESDVRLAGSSATGTIKNDDFDQEVEIWALATDQNLTEGETAMFTLRRQSPDGSVPPQGFGVTPLTVTIGVSQDGDFIAGDPPTTVTFPANHLYAQLRIPTDDDQTAEPNGSMTVSLATGMGYSLGSRNQATVNVQDNDVGISVFGPNAVEEDSASDITFTVTLSRAAPKPVTVDLTTVDGTATSDAVVTATSLGRDFVARSRTLTFEAGQIQKTFSVDLVDDTFDEPREEFTVKLSNPSDNAHVLIPTATGAILDDDEPLMVGVYRTNTRVAEDRESPVDLLLELRPAAGSGTTASEHEVRVDWSLEQGTAIPGADYVDDSGTATIPAGATTGTVDVTLVDDGYLEELLETFSFRIDRAVAAEVDDDNGSVEISIRDDDDILAEVTAATESIAEGSDAEFTVTLSGESAAPVTVTYTVSGTAGDSDYTAPSGTVTVPAASTEAAISITTLTDEVEDADETLIVTLTAAESHGRPLQVSDTAAEATILDQGTLTVSIAGGSGVEGENASFTLSMSAPPGFWVRVNYETVDSEGDVVGEATSGTDFEATDRWWQLTHESPTKTFSIQTIEDNLVEGNETFRVRIVEAKVLTLSENDPQTPIDIAVHTAVLTIIDDDEPPTNVTLAVTPDSVSETAGGTPLSVTATIQGDSRLVDQLPVALDVADGTATEGEDYTAVPVMLYIPAGQASATGPVVLFPVDDAVAGGDVTVQVTGSAQGVAVTPATVTITDDETLPTGVALTVSPGEVREDAGPTGLEVTATLTGGDPRAVDTLVSLVVETSGDSGAVPGVDFTAGQVTLTIPAGETTAAAALTLTPTDDVVAEGDETAQVSGTSDGLLVSPAQLTIVDDDREPTGIELSVTPSEVAEDAGATDLTVTATLVDGDARGADTEVALSVSGVTATETDDFTAQAGVTLTIPAGQMSHTATLTLTPVDDTIRESAEQVAVRGANASDGLPVSGVRVTIVDDDADATAITLSVDRDTIPEDGGAQQLTVTGSLDGDTRSVDTRVTLTISGQTATESDYTALPATLLIRAGQQEGTATVVLDPTDDDIDEPDETLEVSGQARSVSTRQGGSQRSATQPPLAVSGVQVTITDDDTAGVTVTPTSLPVLEGSSSNYTVVLDTQPTADVTVSVSLPAGSDLSVSTTSLTFTASNWNVAQTVTVAAADDDDLADDGTVTIGHPVTSTDSIYAAVTVDSVTVTVNDDDDTVSVNFSAATYTVAESDDSSTTETRENEVTITVTLSADPERSVTVPVTSTNQGGASSADYSGVPASVTFAIGDTEKSFTFTATGDEVDDDGESVKLAFGTLPDGVTAGSTAEAVVSITDDDAPDVTVSFGAATYTVEESDDSSTTETTENEVTITVTLSADPEREVVIPLTAAGQDNASTDDYSGVPASVTFASGDTEKSFTFAATADEVDDDGESVKLAFGTLPDGVTAGTTDESVVSITDDDVPSVTVNFGAATYSVEETDDSSTTETKENEVTITVTLSADAEREVVIPLTAAGQDNASTDDYSGVPASVTFASGDTEKSFTFAATADEVDDDGESVKLAFGTLPDGVTAGTTDESVVSITDDDVPSVTVSFSAATYSVEESDDSSTTETRENEVTIAVTLSADPERSVTVPVTSTNQGGASSADYSGVPASVTFAIGDTEKSFTFTATGDEVDDDGESVKLAFGTLPDGVTAGTTGESVVSITDDDVPSVTASFGSATYSVEETDDSSTTETKENEVTITVTLSADPERSVTVPLTVTNQDGALSADYSGVPASVTFASGDTEKSFTFAATADEVDDDGESVKLAFGTLPDGVTAGTTDESVVSITDDDVPSVTVSFSSATYTVEETDDSSTTETRENEVTIAVTLSADPERSVTVPLTATNQGGASSADYSGVPASVTFAIGDTEESFTFAATADEVDDDGEGVKLSFGTLPDGVTAGTTDESVVSITDDDVPSVTVNFSAATYTVAESDDSSTTETRENEVTITVTLSPDPEREVVIPLTAAGQDNASTDDYSGVPSSVTFASGDTEQSFTFAATADEVDDDGESVKLGFGTLPDGVTAGSTAEAVVSITDDDVPSVTVSFGAATYSVEETDDSSTTETKENEVTITVTLSADPKREVVIPLTAAGQDNASTDDYSGVPSSVTFAIGDTEKSFTFAATADEVDDDGESVKLSFGTLPDGVTAGTTDESVVSITDDDVPSVTVSFGAATYSVEETDDSSTTETKENEVTITVTLSADAEREVVIPLSAAGQDNASTDDYTGVPASVTFAIGDTEKSFTFTATGDEVDDDGESVKLAFGTLPDGVTAGTTDESVVSITDDDVPSVTASFGSATYTAAEGSNATVKVTLSADPERSVTVPVTATNQGGASSADYSGVPASVTFASGDTEKSFTFTATADEVDDDGESVKLALGTLPDGVTAGTPDESVVSITDDDVPSVTVNFSAATYTVAESDDSSTTETRENEVTITVTLSPDPEREVVIPLTAAGQDNASTDDYSGVPSSVTFASGDTEQSFTFAATADEVDDDGESVKLGFGTLPDGVTAGSTAEAVVSITDDDVPSVTVSFGAATYSVEETDDSSTTETKENEVTITVTLSADPKREVVIPLTAAGQDNASTDDYSGVPSSVTFASGDTEQSFTFAATADEVDDDGESVKLSFGTLPDGVTAGTTDESVVSITDDDVPSVTVSFGAATYSVEETDDSSTTETKENEVTITVTLSADAEREVVIPLSAAGQDNASTDDYTGVPASVTFAIGDTEKSFTFTATGDEVDDDGESVKLAFGTLPDGVTAGSTAEAVVTITDDDVPSVTASFGSATYTAAEGSNATVKVTLSADPERSVTVPLTATNQGGASSADYSGVPASVTFASGDTEKSFTFTATADEVDDDGESVKLAFGTLPDGVTAGTPDESVVSITDDDVPAGTVTLVLTPTTIDESGTNNVSTVTATLATASSAVTTITISVPEDSPVTLSSNRTLTIAQGATTSAGAVTITGVDDAVYTGDREVDVSGASSNDVGVTDPDDMTLTITDDEPEVTVSFGAATYTVAESDDSSTTETSENEVMVNVTLSADPERTVTIPITKVNQDGATAEDYSGVPASVTFESGDTSKTFTFTATADEVDDDGESVKLTFGNLPTGVNEGTTAEAVVSITDDDGESLVPPIDNPPGSVVVEETTTTTVNFGSATYTAAEGSSVTVKVTLSADPERSVTIPLTATNQGGASSADYSGVPESVTFASGDTEKSFTFTATDDDVDDAGESVKLAFGALPAGVSAGTPSTSTVSITDDDVPAGTVTLVLTPATIDESGTNNESTVTATLATASSAVTTITVSVPGGSPVTLSSNRTLTIAHGATSSTGVVTITAVDDAVYTGDREVDVSGASSNDVGVTDPDDETLTITDDEVPQVNVNFSSATYTAAEGSSVEVKVTLSADPERSVTVPLTATNQDGASNTDYSGVPASVTFASGDTEKSFTFAATADEVDDDGESVKLAFGALPAGVSAGTPSTSTVSITDDDVPAGTVTLVLTPATIDESGTNNESTVTATLSTASSAVTTITVSVPGGSPVTLSSNRTLTIAHGATSSTGVVTITAVDDAVYTGDREVDVSGASSNDVGVTDPDDETLTITDDEVPPVNVNFSSATYTAAEGSSVEVKVTLSADPERSVTVPLTVTNQDGASSADYSGVPESVTFASGDTEESFTFAATADEVDDDGESVKLAFGALPAGVSAGTPSTSTVSITDDDVPAGTVTLVLTPATIDESGTNNESTVTATLSTASSAVTTITVSVPGGSPVTLSSNRTLTIAHGATSSTGVVTITTVDDVVYTGNREVDVSGASSNDVGVTDPDDETLTITDDDVPSVTVSFGSATYTAAEGSNVTVKVTLSADAERSVTVPLTATNQDGASSADYSGVPESVTFASGDTEKSFTFAATADEVDDDGESVRLGFGTLPDGVTAGTTDESVVSITDDDVPAGTVTLVLTPATIDESGTNNVSTVTATLSTASSAVTTITVSVPQDSPVTLSTNMTLTIAQGATTSTGVVTITAVDDAVYTGDREVDVSGASSNDVGVTDPDDMTLTITDDEPEVTVSFGAATYTVAESDDSSTSETRENEVMVTVTLSADPERTVTIPITKADQGGASSADYSGVPENVVFNAGDTETSFTFTATADDLDDDNESVKLTFGTLPTGVSEGITKETEVSITDDDGESIEMPSNNPPAEGVVDEPDQNIQVLFSSASYEATEGGADAQVTVLLNSAPQSNVEIPLTAAGANGATEDDWSGVPTSLTFNVGDTSKTFTVIATDDDVEDDGEMVNLGFGTLPNGFETGIPGTATITLMNDDTAQNPSTTTDSCGETASATVDTVFTGSVDSPGQIRIVSYALEPHKWYRVDVRGSDSSEATLEDPRVIGTASVLGFRFREGSNFFIGETGLAIQSDRYMRDPFSEMALLPVIFCIYVVSENDRTGTFQVEVMLDTENAPPDGYNFRGKFDTKSDTETRRFLAANLGGSHDFLGDHAKTGNDEDWFGMDLTSGVSYRIDLQTLTTIDGATIEERHQLTEPRIVGIFDQNGTAIPNTASTGNGQKAAVVFRPSESGRYYIGVGSNSGDRNGLYAVCLSKIGMVIPSLCRNNGDVVQLDNHPTVGSPQINGEARVGETLTSEAGIIDLDGLDPTSFRYAWIVDNRVVSNEATHTLTNAELGKRIFLRMTVTDLLGNTTTLIGGGTEPVEPRAGVAASQVQATNEVAPLTVELLDAPESHNGEDTFTFLVLFSESIATSETIVRDKAFEVTGGTVTQASRVDGRSDLWEITVDPDSDADVAITLLSDRACDTEGAICTGDERRLSNGLALLVLGPEVQQDPAPNTPATGAPSITGTPRVGETLTVDTTGISDQDGLEEATFRYRWIAGGNDIAGSNGSSYTIAAEDEGLSIKVQVSFSDDAGNPEVLESLHTAVVVAHDDNDQDGDGQDDEDQDGNGLATLSLYPTATSINEGETLRVRVVRSGPSNIQIDSGLQCYDSATGEYTNAAVRMRAGVTSKVITATYAVDDGKTSSNRTITCEFRSVYDGVEHYIGSPAIVIVAVKE